MDAGILDRMAIREDGWMTATWFQGPARDFIEVSRKGFEAGVNILHQLGGWTCDIIGTRAVSQTKAGFAVKQGLPGLRGAAVERLYAEGWAWLDGAASPGDAL